MRWPPPPKPPNIAPHIAMRATNVMPIAAAAATDVIEDVAVRDVRELVGEHAAQLVLVDDLEQALGDRDRGVVRVAAGRERVRLRGGAEVDRRHRHAGARREVAHDRVELRLLGLGDRHRARRPHRELVGEPVRPADEHDAEPSPMTRPPGPKSEPDGHEEHADAGQQHDGLDTCS